MVEVFSEQLFVKAKAGTSTLKNAIGTQLLAAQNLVYFTTHTLPYYTAEYK